MNHLKEKNLEKSIKIYMDILSFLTKILSNATSSCTQAAYHERIYTFCDDRSDDIAKYIQFGIEGCERALGK